MYYRLLLRQRRLGGQDLEETKNMLSVKANKRMIQQHLLTKSGKTVILKDL